MLEEAHALKRRGVDVVLGYVETHGRAETAALIEGLPEVPRKTFQYRGVAIEEMDLEGLLERRPEITVVDEIAHTNVPGSRNRRRYQDVLALLDAGINVIGAFNIQHLESLNDVVQRVTGVAIRETVPDSFLKRADQVVNLDLAVEDSAGAAAGREDLRRRQGPLGAGALLQGPAPGDAARARPARGGGEPRPGRSPAQRRGRAERG